MDTAWKRALAAVRQGEGTHAEIAARFGVPVAGLRYRLYRDRARQNASASQTPTVSVLPVQVVEHPAQGQHAEPCLEASVGDITVRFPVGCAPDYVAALLRALRAC